MTAPRTPLYGDPEVGVELQALMVEAIQQASGQDCGHVVGRASLCVRCPADGLRCLGLCPAWARLGTVGHAGGVG